MFTARGKGGLCASQTAAADRHKMRTSNTKDKCTDSKQSHRSKSCIATGKYSGTTGVVFGNGGNGGMAVQIAWEWQLGKKMQRARAAQRQARERREAIVGQAVCAISKYKQGASERTAEQVGSRACVRDRPRSV